VPPSNSPCEPRSPCTSLVPICSIGPSPNPSPTNWPLPTNAVFLKSRPLLSLPRSFTSTRSLTQLCATDPIIGLSRAQAQDRALAKCRCVPPYGRYSRENDWWETPALGPRVSKLAPFLRGFSEPPGRRLGGNRLCRSRFSSVSSGDSASSPGSPGEKTVPFCATWKGILSHHPHPSSPPDPPAGVCHLCNVDGHLLLPPPFLSREGPSVQRRPIPPLESSPAT
jgi:hypothetical protein